MQWFVLKCQQRIYTHLWSVLLCKICSYTHLWISDVPFSYPDCWRFSKLKSSLCAMLILIIKVCSMYSSFRWIVELCSFYLAHFFSYAREHSLCHHMTFSTVEEFVNRWRKHVVLNNLVQVSCEILLKLGWHLSKSIKYGVLNEQKKSEDRSNYHFWPV